MDFGALLLGELLLLGSVAGFLAGLLGIGGGMMMVPFLSLILTQRGVDEGLAVKMAIATSMCTIMFTALSSLRAHHARGAVRWDLVRRIAPGIVAGGLLSGGAAFAMLRGEGLALLFAAFAVFSGVRMLLGHTPPAGRTMPGRAVQALAGATIGFVSGLLGAGGAFMSVPFMTRANVPLRHALATSAALGFPIAASSTVGYVIAGWHLPATVPGAVGYLYLPGLVVISAASVTMAPVGARVAHGGQVATLRRVFAVMLLIIGGHMAWRSLT